MSEAEIRILLQTALVDLFRDEGTDAPISLRSLGEVDLSRNTQLRKLLTKELVHLMGGRSVSDYTLTVMIDLERG